jgi:LPS sulfotransferase NodH
VSGVWDPLRADLDTDPPLEPPCPRVSYIVCSTPRSGSGLLCRGLAATGVAGIPAGYFNANKRVPLARRWGCGDSLDAYAVALRARRTDAGGTFGTKLHWSQLQEIDAEDLRRGPGGPGGPGGAGSAGREEALLERLLPGSRFVRIVRLDIDAQAVSLWTALRTGRWSLSSAAPPPAPRTVPYSYSGILRCRQQIVDGEVGWDRFFRRSGIAPAEVVYEELAAHYASVVRETLERILPGSVTPAVPEPVSRRQAGERSAELLARFSKARRRRRPPASHAARSALSVVRQRMRA